jgi:hypothetical protein
MTTLAQELRELRQLYQKEQHTVAVTEHVLSLIADQCRKYAAKGVDQAEFLSSWLQGITGNTGASMTRLAEILREKPYEVTAYIEQIGYGAPYLVVKW